MQSFEAHMFRLAEPQSIYEIDAARDEKYGLLTIDYAEGTEQCEHYFHAKKILNVFQIWPRKLTVVF